MSSKFEYNEDEMNSFLASPKNEIIGFFNKAKNIQDSKMGNTIIEDSTMISRENLSKSLSHYDIRCKKC